MIKELYLKTAFCCMACDGEIAPEEIDVLKEYVKDSAIFESQNVEDLINGYIQSINETGISFLNSYLEDVKSADLSKDEILQLIKIAFEMIEADKKIEYSEVKFFKRIRSYLDITDEEILAVFPEKEDFLLPDIVQQEYEFNLNTKFTEIKLNIV